MSKSKTKAYLAWITICIVWGTTYLAIRIGVADLPPMLFAGLRWIFSGSLIYIFLKFRKFQSPSFNDLKHIAIIGLALLGVANGLVVVAEQWIPSGLTALLLSTLPFWVVTIEGVLPGGNRFNSKKVVGLLIGLSGIAIIFRSEIENLFNTEYLFGVLCLMMAVISWASGSIYSKSHKVNVHPLMSAAVQMLIAGIAQSVAGLMLGEASAFTFTVESFYAFLYLAFVGSILGYGSYIYAISHLPVSFVTTYAYINPVIALILGWLVLNEPLNAFIGISALLILTGIFLVKKGQTTD